MAVGPNGRGAQQILTGEQQSAARGGMAATMHGNSAAMAATTLPPQTFTLEYPLALPVADGVVARAGGGHANATPLPGAINNVARVLTVADSVSLLQMVPGEMIWVINTGVQAAQVYGYGTSTINGSPTDTGVSHPAGKIGLYIAITPANIRAGWLG